MTVLNFTFADDVHSWKLETTGFSEFNLLVGGSGVGKTRILQAIHSVRRAGLRGAGEAPGCSWTLNVKIGATSYEWAASTSQTPPSVRDFIRYYEVDDDSDGESADTSVVFEKESIRRDGEVLVERDSSQFLLGKQSLPKLKPTESAIALLRDDERLAELNLALRRFLFSSAHQQMRHFVPFDVNQVERIGSTLTTLEKLRDAPLGSILLKGYLLQRLFPDEFEKVKQDYIDIFPQVTDIGVGKASSFSPLPVDDNRFPVDWITMAIREKNVPFWLLHQKISSGMLRTLAHLLELALAPQGTVILIDEFENSLGVNCLPHVANSILSRKDLQFVVTSHHPYVINNVTPDLWRIVTRDGSTVKVRDFKDIPALSTGSRHDAFTILMNLPEIEQGVR